MQAKKLKPYAVRLEWASTISYCDVAVMASTPARAVRRAMQECDYDMQRNYDDGGETYASAVAKFRTKDAAEAACDNGDVWDHYSGQGIPLKDESGDEQAHQLWKQVAYLTAALERCRDAMREAAAHCNGDTLARVENEANKAEYLIAQAPR